MDLERSSRSGFGLEGCCDTSTERLGVCVLGLRSWGEAFFGLVFRI